MEKTSSDAYLAINDLASVLLGVGRADRLIVANLLDRSHLPSVNEILSETGCHIRLEGVLITS
ncbi:Hypothetical protein FKW44_018963 [Caligus rogercresseyi]|uniref:Uncharacterized protein n=1 Tax=Caligus rogercresseyi TaxID=217165 RepID=A0A7T8GV63_CALRO|nr:Hypothetical protein FKW44_018963 [Caligus rogercresseyi]